MTSNKTIWAYLASLFATAWGIQLICLIISRDFEHPLARLCLFATMLSPLVVSLIFLKKDQTLKSYLRWKPSKGIFITSLWAVLVPIVSALLVLGIMHLMAWGQSAWFNFSIRSVEIKGGPFLLGLGAQNWLFFLGNLFITGLAYAILTGIVAVGEEFAWRGLLQGILIERMGASKGIIVLGLIWSFWHFPVQIAGYNFPENPIIGSLILSPILLIGLSFFYAWLTYKSNSFWPAALAHGAYNTIEEGIISNLQLFEPMLCLHLVKMMVTFLIGLLFLQPLLKRGHPSQN
jgi:uncharacterized protein